MKNNNNNTEKKVYYAPIVKRIQLDNEISLTLASNDEPPIDPIVIAPNYFNNDPFKPELT